MATVLFAVVFFKVYLADAFNVILTASISIVMIIEMLYLFFSEDNSYER